MKQAPKQSSTLFELLEDFCTAHAVDEIALMRLKKAFAARIHSEPVVAFCGLGALAGKSGDIKSADNYYVQALAAAGESPIVLYNYALSLARMGRYAPALQCCMRAYDKAPPSSLLLALASNACLALGLDKRAKAFLREHEDAYPGEELPKTVQVYLGEQSEVRAHVMRALDKKITDRHELWTELSKP